MSSLSVRRCRALVLSVSALSILAALMALAAPSHADTGAPSDGADPVDGEPVAEVVDILPLEGFVDPPVAGAITDLIADANERGSTLVVLQLDSPGAVSVAPQEVVEAIQASEVPVAVYVGPPGADAAARGGAGLVALGAHVLGMADGAQVGPLVPATVGDGDGAPREVLAAAGLAPQAVEALLDDEAEGWTVETVRTALAENGGSGAPAVVDASGLEPLLVELDGRTVTVGGEERELRIRRDEVGVRFHSLGLVRRVLHAATTPAFIYLLLVAGLGMLLFEAFQPGFGVAGIAGVITGALGVFGLTVLPVTWWAVALVVLGLVLFAIDVAVAGFGPVTAIATAAFGAGSWWFYDDPSLVLPWWLVVVTTLTALGFFVIVMTVVLRAQAGPETAALDDLVGKVGIVRSVLNPEGHVYIDQALWRARWTGEGRRAKVGLPVRVHGIDGALVLVEPFDPDEVRASRAAARDGSDA